MGKLKTHRGAAKRFKVTGGGRVKRWKAYKSHILTKMTTKRKRNLRGGCMVDESDMGRMADMLPMRGVK